jgi:hypothetical protein
MDLPLICSKHLSYTYLVQAVSFRLTQPTAISPETREIISFGYGGDQNAFSCANSILPVALIHHATTRARIVALALCLDPGRRLAFWHGLALHHYFHGRAYPSGRREPGATTLPN